jgi:AcrR family transcriptional regulator
MPRDVGGRPGTDPRKGWRVTGGAAAGRRRRSVAETRDLLLHAAVDLLRERAEQVGDDVVAAALAHVRFAQVAERATALVRSDSAGPDAPAVTTGAIYNLWPNQPDFQVDLLLHVAELQAALDPGLGESVHRFRAAAAACVPLEDVLRELAELVYRHYRDDALFRVELSFLIGVRDPRVHRALARRREAFSAVADQAWQGLLDAYGLRLRAPWRIRDLTEAVASCLIGSVVLAFADPGDPAADPGDPAADPGDPAAGADRTGGAEAQGRDGWSPVSRAVRAVFEAFTETG